MKKLTDEEVSSIINAIEAADLSEPFTCYNNWVGVIDMDTLQFKADEDNFVYFFNKKKGIYQKLGDVGAFSKLPISVKKKIHEAAEQAENILRLPRK